MTRYAVTRLAAKLLEIHYRAQSFDFEVDTPENARQLGLALEALGCMVTLGNYGGRITVHLPEKKMLACLEEHHGYPATHV